MNNREAVKALVDGSKVRAKNDEPGTYLHLDGGEICTANGVAWGRLDELLGSFYANLVFEIYEEPATDEELIAEFVRLSVNAHRESERDTEAAYAHAAKMLRTRKVTP